MLKFILCWFMIEYSIGLKGSLILSQVYELEEEFGWRSQQDFGTLYPLFNSPLGLDFNAMFRRKKSKS